jgi:dihydroorotate dehydrogenase (NAD+) catalytic subunit
MNNSDNILKTSIAGLELKNPAIAASGTYGYGTEYDDFCPSEDWGAVILKSVSENPRAGNPPPRCCEVESGMINSIGLANVGVENFLSDKMPEFRNKHKNSICIASIAGESLKEFEILSEKIETAGNIDAVEINISCPNVSKGGMHFGSDPASAAEVIGVCRKKTKLPILAKISPAAGSPVDVARACADSGADIIVAINTVPGMKIDIEKGKPVLGNIFGGMSGPAMYPAALRIAFMIHKALPEVPLIGCGGIDSADTALQFMMAGCSSFQMGTSIFRNPESLYTILDDICIFMQKKGYKSLKDCIGIAAEY